MIQRTRSKLCLNIKSLVVLFTCHKVPKTNSSQGDDDKVQGLQRRPALDVFKDGCREGHKQQAAKQHEQQRGYDPDLCLTDLPMLHGKEKDIIQILNINFVCLQAGRIQTLSIQISNV